MSIFNIFHKAVHLFNARGFTHFTGTAGYIHISAGRDITQETSDEAEAPVADDRGKGRNDIEAVLLDKFSLLSSDDQSAILRFVEYASNPDAQHKGAKSYEAVEDWLDAQARMYTQGDTD